MEFLFEQFGFYSRDELRSKAEEIIISASDPITDIKDWQKIFSCLDHTSLDGTDHPAKILDFTNRVNVLGNTLSGKPHVAAVCVYPVFASVVSKVLEQSPIYTAAVAGAFPSGLSPLWLRLDEVRFALEQGADEIDMVISRGRLLSGDYNFVFDEVAAIKEVCGNKNLKVILETGELNDPLQISRASEIAMRAGADFLKTSTGKVTVGSTPEALLVMMDCIGAYYKETGKKIGIKAAGGIAETSTAYDIVTLLRNKLGEDWFTPSLFRIGASRLTDKIAGLLLVP